MPPDPAKHNADTGRKLPRWVQISSMVVVYGAIIGYVVFHVNHHTGAIKLAAQPCLTAGQSIQIKVHDGKFIPDPVNVKRCDIVTITNSTNLYFEPAFGPHNQHIIYPTFRETALKPGQSMQFEASVPGSFELHDHLRDEIETTLTVSP